MSITTDRLRSRAVADHEVTIGEVAVSDLPLGTSAVVSRLCADADPSAARRFFDLGFAPGAEVVAVRRAPMRGPVVVRVAGYEIALRRRQADCIKVIAAA
ncbi:FeoA family protein [Williamsia herbipolensis]|uniref:Ferrous iron transport protein A n=1 Tax=Williamsia herbipolensis TaxID=1603258 RepID=A0AAU4JX60_9NOCA|nr:FeoA family protein [Williamsia herbipolensis]MCX6469124.1 FeoA family protein [Mycobacteriales bacterium]